ncbi:MAG: ion transporter [Flavobacteriales bacterium]|nr:ion transporter [Flavobacteriales bacterium]
MPFGPFKNISHKLLQRILQEDPQAFRKRLSLKHLKLIVEEVIFGVETRWGKTFDVVLLWAILLSLVAIMFESIPAFREQHGAALYIIEWAFTIFFTIEYALRLWASEKPKEYAFSFLGVIDLLAIIPTYLSLIVVGSQFLLVIRAIRLLRVFRILKLVRYLKGAQMLVTAMNASKEKIFVFLTSVVTLAVILGTLMYMVEGGENGFDSIPRSIYWAIVTLTTVGYGDIAPGTTVGQFLAALIMILGYSIIAVPTGIVSVEIARASDEGTGITCPRCGETEHFENARFCHKCGEKFVPNE